MYTMLYTFYSTMRKYTRISIQFFLKKKQYYVLKRKFFLLNTEKI